MIALKPAAGATDKAGMMIPLFAILLALAAPQARAEHPCVTRCKAFDELKAPVKCEVWVNPGRWSVPVLIMRGDPAGMSSTAKLAQNELAQCFISRGADFIEFHVPGRKTFNGCNVDQNMPGGLDCKARPLEQTFAKIKGSRKLAGP